MIGLSLLKGLGSLLCLVSLGLGYSGILNYIQHAFIIAHGLK